MMCTPAALSSSDCSLTLTPPMQSIVLSRMLRSLWRWLSVPRSDRKEGSSHE